MSNVTRMADHAPVACDDDRDLIAFGRNWMDALAGGDYAELRSMVIVLESKDGRMATLAQSLGAMDNARLVSLLTIVAHRKMDGSAEIEGLHA